MSLCDASSLQRIVFKVNAEKKVDTNPKTSVLQVSLQLLYIEIDQKNSKYFHIKQHNSDNSSFFGTLHS